MPGEVYNLATGVETTILEVAKIINNHTGNLVPFELKPARAWDNSGNRFASIQKSKKELNFRAKVDIEDGLTRTIKWTIDNKKVISNTINKHKNKI